MDGSRDYYTKWSKSDRGGQIYNVYHLRAESKKQSNELVCKINRLRHRKQTHGSQNGKEEGQEIHTAVYKTTGPTV